MSALAANRWSPEREALLVRLHGSKMTMAAMATELGVTRNAVIGKSHRLGLSTPARMPPRQPPVKTAALVKRMPRPVLKSDDRERLRGLPLFCKATRFNASAPTPLRVDIMGLRASSCRYMVDAREYCGHRTGGGSWCPHHAQLVYQPSKRRAA